MSLMSRLKQLFTRRSPQTPPIRSLPQPTRVHLADHEEHGRRFVRVPEWSSLSPAPPAWQIPDLASQCTWIDDIVASHQDRGSLDGFVPDLLDRGIHHQIREAEREVRAAHHQALYTEHYLYQQAKLAQHELNVELSAARAGLSEAEQGYVRAYEALTWERPAQDLTARAVEPALISNQTADVAPAGEPAAITALIHPATTMPAGDDERAESPESPERTSA